MLQQSYNRAHVLMRHLAPLHSVTSSAAVASYRQGFPSSSSRSSSLHTSSCHAAAQVRLPAPRASFAPGQHNCPKQSKQDEGRLTVFLDMDENLLHSWLTHLPAGAKDPRSVDDHEDERAAHIKDKKPYDFTFEIGGTRDARGRVTEKELVRSVLRPHLHEFLHALSAEFEPILFTSAMEIYASPLLDRIDPKTGPNATPSHLYPLFRHRFYRPHTVTLNQFEYVKDISRLNRDMKRCVLIDNSWMACVANPENCIITQDYLGEAKDDTLLRVLEILRKLKNEEDVRPVLAKMIRFREAMTQAGIEYAQSEEEKK